MVSLTEFLLYLAASYGLTFFFVDSTFPPWDFLRSKLEKVGFLKELLDCYFCTGFWSSLLMFVVLSESISLPFWPGFLLFSFSGAAASYVLFMIVSAIDSYISGR